MPGMGRRERNEVNCVTAWGGRVSTLALYNILEGEMCLIPFWLQ